jgi:uncharacterized membrane protein YhaH (DUF805 family)
MITMEAIIFIIILWACWHWFIKDFIYSSGIAGKVKTHIALQQVPDEKYYEQAYQEIQSENVREGLWAKALTQSDGDEKKTHAQYIKLRVDALKLEAIQQFDKNSADNGELIKNDLNNISPCTNVVCSSCDKVVPVPHGKPGKLSHFRCSGCGDEFFVDPTQGCHPLHYAIHDGKRIGRIGRGTFSWLFFSLFIINLVYFIFAKEGGFESPGNDSLFLMTAIGIIIFASYMAIIVARLHDIDKSGWISLIALIPLINIGLIVYLLVIPGTQGRNIFGPLEIGLFVING